MTLQAAPPPALGVPDAASRARKRLPHRAGHLALGATLCAAAVASVLVTWVLRSPSLPTGSTAVLFGFLTASITASRLWPIRIGKSVQIYIGSVPLYLLCCLYDPAVAATGIGVGMLVGELRICRRCGNSAGTVASQIGRWMLLGLVVSVVAHLWPASYLAYSAALAALLLWMGDVLTCPCILTPVTGKGPVAVMLMAARQSYTSELMQYLIAMLTLLLFRTGILWTGILWVDLLSTQLVVLPIVLLYLSLRSADRANGIPQSVLLHSGID